MRWGVFHAGALGDCILALHVVRGVAASLSQARGGGRTVVGLVARSPVARLAVGRSLVESAWDLDGPGMSTLFAATCGAIDASVGEIIGGFDGIISFCGGADLAPATRLREVAAGPVWAVDPRVRAETVAAGRHITEQWIGDLRRQGLEVGGATDEVLIGLEETDREYGRRCWRRLADAGAPLTNGATGGRVLLHPGSGGRAKCWPVKRFEELATLLRTQGWQVAFMIGPVEMDWYGDELARRLAETAAVIYEEDLAQAASVIAGADVFVGNDAGITHLAAALGVPSVAIYGPTSPGVWRPLGPAVRVFRGSGGGAEPFAGVAVLDVSLAVADAYGTP